MSSKAEQRASEAYPGADDVEFYYETEPGVFSPVTTYGLEKRCFVQGYEQAEKDLAEENIIIRKDWFEHLKESWYKEGEIAGKYSLTTDDIELLHTFLYAVKNNKQGVFTFTRLSNEQYQEVINRFYRKKKHRQKPNESWIERTKKELKEDGE